MTLYRVGTSYAKKRWLRPRMVQLVKRARCLLGGHDWSAWRIDDVDGPCEHLPNGGVVPLLAREARPGEFGTRACARWCGAVQTRRPDEAGLRGGRLQDRDD